MKNVKVGDKLVKAQIWDTGERRSYCRTDVLSGTGTLQSNYFSLLQVHLNLFSLTFRSAVGAMLVYDIVQKETFDNIERWLAELKQHADQHIEIMLVGNKSGVFTRGCR